MNSVIVFFLIVSTLHGVGTWKLYKSASYDPYIAFIPILNILILLKIINKKWWNKKFVGLNYQCYNYTCHLG